MHDELKIIAVAIEGLKEESNPFKDYVFPVVMAFFSSVLGAFTAYFTLLHQDKNKIQKDRVHSLNDWILTAQGMLSNLISIKSQYADGLTNDPIQRTMHTRSIIKNHKSIDKDIASLAFIVPNKKDTPSHGIKWRQISKIPMMVENYNLILDMWAKRIELDRPIKEKIAKDYDLIAGSVTPEQIFQSIEPSEFTILVDITEKSIKYTDDLIVEINDFLVNIPKIGKSLINEKHTKAYGPIISFSSETNPHLQRWIRKLEDVDYSILAALFGKTEEEVRKEYETGYE